MRRWLCVGDLLATGAVHALANHLAQLPLLGEFATEDAEVVDEVAADLDEGGARGDGAVGLDAEFELAGVVVSEVEGG